MRVYEHWVQDYLDQELVKSDPRSFEIFLCDRFHDYLRGFLRKEARRRKIVETELPVKHLNGSVRSRMTGEKVALYVVNDSPRTVDPLWTVASLTPESLIDLRNTVESLSGELRQIALLILKGWIQKEIADLLKISEATVSRRVNELRMRLGEEKQVHHKRSINQEVTPQEWGERL